jgi:hypothetical protein
MVVLAEGMVVPDISLAVAGMDKPHQQTIIQMEEMEEHGVAEAVDQHLAVLAVLMAAEVVLDGELI